MPGIIDDDARGSGSGSDGDQTSLAAEYERGRREGLAEGRVEGLAEGRRLERETLAALHVTLTAVADGEDEAALASQLDVDRAVW